MRARVLSPRGHVIQAAIDRYFGPSWSYDGELAEQVDIALTENEQAPCTCAGCVKRRGEASPEAPTPLRVVRVGEDLEC